MAHILFRPALFVVIALSLSLLAGCAGDPVQQANESVAEANESIEEHNRLYNEARATYEEAREAVENGEDPSEEVERVTEARETLEEAQESLLGSREPLAEVRDLNVDPEVREYAALLLEAVDAQIAAEDREIAFYQILEEDPSLEDDRERALDILAEVEDGYQRAKDNYARAEELANANPELIKEG